AAFEPSVIGSAPRTTPKFTVAVWPTRCAGAAQPATAAQPRSKIRPCVCFIVELEVAIELHDHERRSFDKVDFGPTRRCYTTALSAQAELLQQAMEVSAVEAERARRGRAVSAVHREPIR